MSVLPNDRLAHLIADYPTTPNDVLATRYDLTPTEVLHIARANQLHKNNLAAAMAARTIANQPAPLPLPLPVMTDAPYCPGCGLTHHHWPGCPRIGTDDRPVHPKSLPR